MEYNKSKEKYVSNNFDLDEEGKNYSYIEAKYPHNFVKPHWTGPEWEEVATEEEIELYKSIEFI